MINKTFVVDLKLHFLLTPRSRTMLLPRFDGRVSILVVVTAAGTGGVTMAFDPFLRNSHQQRRVVTYYYLVSVGVSSAEVVTISATCSGCVAPLPASLFG